MQPRIKYILAYIGAIGITSLLLVSLAQAQEDQRVVSVEVANEQTEGSTATSVLLDKAQLDQLLAPIALYPDSVLSHILVASTYPLELVQAARWRQDHRDLDEQEALDAVEDEDWDPSVKALVPFTDLLEQLVEDLNWLQDLGDAFLGNEEQVLASVQSLRRKAYDQGSLQNNQYVEVVEEEDDILIQPVNERIIYVPYYDTRVVYGNWWWADYPPYYWHRPAHYYVHAGFYWSPRVYVRHSVFFSGFHWHNRHVVVHHYPSRHYGRYDDGRRRVRVTEYQRWSHNPEHRRGVRYTRNVSERYATVRDSNRQRVNRRDVVRAENPRATRPQLPRQSSGDRVQQTRENLKKQHRPLNEDRYKQPTIKQTKGQLRTESLPKQTRLSSEAPRQAQRESVQKPSRSLNADRYKQPTVKQSQPRVKAETNVPKVQNKTYESKPVKVIKTPRPKISTSHRSMPSKGSSSGSRPSMPSRPKVKMREK